MSYKIHLVALCNSQYFGGHHLPVVQILVDENTTYEQVKQEMLSYQNYEHLFEDARFGDENVSYDLGFSSDVYKKAVEEFWSFSDNLDYVPDSFYGIGSFEENEEHDCYMYFVVDPMLEE